MGSKVPTEEIAPQLRSFDALLTFPAEKAAAQILDAVTRRRARLLIASSAKLPDLLARLAPVGHTKLIALVAAAVNSRSRPTAASPNPVAD
jgi:hypothetical protein